MEAPGTRTIVCGMHPVITDAQPIGGLRKIRNSPITGRIGQVDGFNLPYLLFAAALFGCYFRFLYNKTPTASTCMPSAETRPRQPCVYAFAAKYAAQI